MGIQGMTNWKFIAFFAVSLMLIAGIFANTAIAKDGAGTASATWAAESEEDLTLTFRGSNKLYGAFDQGVRTLPSPLPAGSTENQLMMSYRVTQNMAGGAVEFSLPSGWTIIKKLTDDTATINDVYTRFSSDSKRLVVVHERWGTTDTTTDAQFVIDIDGKARDRDGNFMLDNPTEAADIADKGLSGRVSVGARSVLVNLSNEWRAGGEVVVVLRNVQTPVPPSLTVTSGTPYRPYPLTTKSKKDGRLDLLDPIKINHDGDTGDNATPLVFAEPNENIRVGSILGNSVDDDTKDGFQNYDQDQITRDFTITPDVVYNGETGHTFKVVFNAKGPMYTTYDENGNVSAQASIVVTIPSGIQAADNLGNLTVSARGPVSPSGNLSVGTAETNQVVVTNNNSSNNTATIKLTRIDKGATITLTHTLKDKTDGIAGGVNPSGTDAKDSAFAIKTNVGGGLADNASSITGGIIHTPAGSGTMAITTPSDAQVEANEYLTNTRTVPTDDPVAGDIVLTYTAATTVAGSLVITVGDGIQQADNDANDSVTVTTLQKASTLDNKKTDDYGYVTFVVKDDKGKVAENGVTLTLTPTTGPVTTITLAGLSLKKNYKVMTFIKNVKIRETGGTASFATSIAGTAFEAARNPTLYITSTKNDAVEFKINDLTFESFMAAEEMDTLKFTFTAVNTAIKGGQVKFTLPNGWTPMVAPSTDGKLDKLGELKVSGGGFQIKGTKKTPLSISNGGKTLTLGVPMLALNETVTVVINSYTGTDEIAHKVTVQNKKTEANKPEEIEGKFWPSSSRTGTGHTAGKVLVEITNVADGYGTAKITPDSVRAGSDDQEITVDFTAAGTMDGGAVRLVIPDGWGNLQDDDSTLANYVQVSVRNGGKATANVANRAVIANLTGVEAGSVVRFSYGGGTVKSRNGAEAQATIASAKAPAEFEIESDGDGDGAFTNVRG